MGVVGRLSREKLQPALLSPTMKGFLPFLCLLGFVVSMHEPMDAHTNKMVNEMVDVIESGLSENREADPRALFISLTLTSTSTLPIVTTTVTRNTAAFCWSSSGSLSACTTTTAATTTTTTTATTTTTVAATGRKKRSPYHMMNMKEQFEHTVQDFVDARVFLDGQEVSIDMILPTSSHASERSDLEDMLAEQTMYTNKDAPGLMSGRMEWSEVGIESGNLHKPCGRSDKVTPEKRPRIIALQNEIVTRTLTSTSTVFSTTATRTFMIEAACTPSTFTGFAVPACASATTTATATSTATATGR